MTSAELIEEIKKADPNGTAVVDMCIYFVATMEGYYDGHSTYLDGENIVFDRQSTKLRFYTMGLHDIAWDLHGNFEKCKELTVFKGVREDTKENILTRLKHECDRAYAWHIESENRFFTEIKERYKDGDRIYRDKKPRPIQGSDTSEWKYNIHYYILADGRVDQCNQGTSMCVVDSGKFEEWDMGEVILYEIKPEYL